MATKHFTLFTALVAGLFASATAASALTYDANTMGTSAPSGMTFTPSGGALGLKSQAGFKFLGVTGGGAGNEIDVGQAITVTFDKPMVVANIIIGLLFDGPEYVDPLETAKLMVIPGGLFSLQATGETSAVWSGLGSVVNLSPAIGGLGGVWMLLNPFGDAPVWSITFYSDTAKHDFGLVGITVPDTASTLSLLGLSILGLAFFRRRARA